MTVQGKGPDLVLLHGWGMNAKVWLPLLTLLKPYFRITCIDLPGHGKSNYDQPWSLDEVAGALAEQLPRQFHLLGWSLGGMLALRFSELYPGRVNKLILLAASAKFTQAENWPNAQLESTLGAFKQNLEINPKVAIKRFLLLQTRGMENTKPINKWLKGFVDEGGGPQINGLLSGLDALATTDLRETLRALSTPIFMLMGEEDQLVPAAVSQQSLQINSAITVAVIKGSAHLPFVSHSEECAIQIKNFLE